MDEIDIQLLKNILERPDQPIRKSFSGISAKERTLYRKIVALEQNRFVKFDTSQPGKILVRITGLGKAEIIGRTEPTSLPRGEAP